MQPIVHLKANGGDRAVVAVGEPVNLTGTIMMPPKTGKIFKFHWSQTEMKNLDHVRVVVP